MKTNIRKNLRLPALMALIAAFATTQLNAQTTTVELAAGGKIMAENDRGIENVNLSLTRAADSTVVKIAVSDKNGSYRFDNLQPGEYFVSASITGYKKARTRPFTLNTATPYINLENLQMALAATNLQEVVIVGQKPFIEQKMDKLVMNVENSSVSAGSTAMEVLEKAPGVTIDKDDNISMRGKQGVLIMLDGKPSYMSNADVANMLRNMQSSQIESIELITSPSARYDAAGTSGIINIKTAKSKNAGLNGSFTAGGGYGNRSKYSAGTNLNYRKGKTNVFGNYTWSNNGRTGSLDLNREVSYQNLITNFRQENQNDTRRNGNSFKAGVDYFAGKNHTLGFMLNGYSNKNQDESSNYTRMMDESFQLDSFNNVSGNTRQTYDNLAYNLNYKGVLSPKGTELTLDLDYSDYSAGWEEFRYNYYYNADGTDKKAPKNLKNFAPSTIKIKSYKLDFVQPFSKSSKMEAGLKSSWAATDNNLKFEQLIGSSWVSDPQVSNHFQYNENINAAYLNFSTEFKTTSLQLGLRTEQTISRGRSVTLNKDVIDRNYFEFFPSATLSRKVGKNNQLGLSYSRRINRPAYSSLNPFLYFLDEYTFRKGNEFLKPQFTNSYSLTHTFKGRYTTTLNFSRTTDVITTVTEQDDISKKTYAIDKNLNSQAITSITVYAPVSFSKGWNINNNLQLFAINIRSVLNGAELRSQQKALSYNMDHTITITKTLTAEASLRYSSPLAVGIFKLRSVYVVNTGLRKTFMDNKASLRFSFSDIFNTQNQRISTTFQNMNLNFVEKAETQIGRLTFSYNFGRKEIKPARRRSTGMEEEQNRIGN